MYILNGIVFNIVKTWAFESDRNDPKNGSVCVVLRSQDERYELILDADTFSKLSLKE